MAKQTVSEASPAVAVPDAIKMLLADEHVVTAIAGGMEFATVVKLKEGEVLRGVFVGRRDDKIQDQNTDELKDVKFSRFQVQKGVIAEILDSAQLERYAFVEGSEYFLMKAAQQTTRQGNKVNTYFIGKK